MRLKQTTQLPNEAVDAILPTTSGAQFKLYVLIIRLTIGWRKIRDRITNAQFIARTNLSRRIIIEALKVLEDRDLIAVTDRNGILIPRDRRKGRSDIYYTPFTSSYAQKCIKLGTFVTKGVQKMTPNKNNFGKPIKQKATSVQEIPNLKDKVRMNQLINQFRKPHD